MRITIIVAATCVCSGLVSAQTCPPPAPSGGSVYFEFQVETPARFAGDSASRPVPGGANARGRPFPTDFALAQFVVDSAGVPAVSSLRMLAKPDSLSLEAVRAALPNWRFSPARLAGCNVPQLVQTPLRWR